MEKEDREVNMTINNLPFFGDDEIDHLWGNMKNIMEGNGSLGRLCTLMMSNQSLI